MALVNRRNVAEVLREPQGDSTFDDSQIRRSENELVAILKQRLELSLVVRNNHEPHRRTLIIVLRAAEDVYLVHLCVDYELSALFTED